MTQAPRHPSGRRVEVRVRVSPVSHSAFRRRTAFLASTCVAIPGTGADSCRSIVTVLPQSAVRFTDGQRRVVDRDLVQDRGAQLRLLPAHANLVGFAANRQRAAPLRTAGAHLCDDLPCLVRDVAR
jgi:hypothetical protein